ALTHERDSLMGRSAEIDSLRQEIAGLQQERDAAHRAAEAMTHERDGLMGRSAEVDALRQEVASLQREREAARQQAEALTHERDDMAAHQTEAEKTRQELNDLALQMIGLRQEREAARAQVEALSREKDSLALRLTDAEAGVHAQSSLREERDRLASERASLEAALQQTGELLQSERAGFARELELARKQGGGEGPVGELENQIRAPQAEIYQHRKQAREYESNLAALSLQMDMAARAQPSQDRDLNARLEQERRHWEEEHERRLAAEREELEALRKEVTSQRSTLRGLGIDVWHD